MASPLLGPLLGNSGGANSSTYQSHIAEFVPGYQPLQLPADAGILLNRSNWLTFNLHYTPIGVATNDQPVLALWYHQTKPPKAWGVTAAANTGFSIPPGVSDYSVQAEWTTQNPITVHRLNPHMHVRGKRMKYKSFIRGGQGSPPFRARLRLWLANWVVSGAFDNSPQNLANPDPSATVRWGDQSWMEMFVGFIDFTQ